MASLIYNQFKAETLKGTTGYDMDAGPAYTALVMTNTTADTENGGTPEILDMADFTTLDELDGSGYNSSARQELDSIAVNKDNGNNRAEFDAADETFSALGNGTRQIQGVVIYYDPDDDGDVADDALNLPWFFIEFSATINPGGSDLVIQWNAEGIVQFS